MDYKFKKHKISDAERLWLQEVAKSKNWNAKIPKVRFFNGLPTNFNPKKIDKKLYRNGRLTLIGLWHVDPNNSLFEEIDTVIRTIQNCLSDDPGQNKISVGVLEKANGLSSEQIGRALYEISLHSKFLKHHGLGGSNNKIDWFETASEEDFNAIFNYESVDDLIEESYNLMGIGYFERFIASFGSIDWSTIKKFGNTRIIKSSYIWLIIVPTLAKILGKLDSPIELIIFDAHWAFVLSLPFSWKIFYFSAISFSFATLLFILKCPKIVIDHDSATSFIEEGKSLEQLKEYAKDIGQPIKIWPSGGKDVEKLEFEYKRSFWSIRNDANVSRISSLILCSIFYAIGLILISIVFLQNLIFVVMLIA